MIQATFHMEGRNIVSFQVEGHSGLAEAGKDVLCAAVTSAVRLAECTVNEVLGVCAAVRADERTAAISFRLPGSLGDAAESASQAVLTGLMVYLSELHVEYPEHVEVLEAQ